MITAWCFMVWRMRGSSSQPSAFAALPSRVSRGGLQRAAYTTTLSGATATDSASNTEASTTTKMWGGISSRGSTSACLVQGGALLPAILAPRGHQLSSAFSRGFAAHGVKPKFLGGKVKTSTAYKERFKLTGTGKIKYMRPGYRHKRFVKTSKQKQALRKSTVLHITYAKTMKKLGFKMTTF